MRPAFDVIKLLKDICILFFYIMVAAWSLHQTVLIAQGIKRLLGKDDSLVVGHIVK